MLALSKPGSLEPLRFCESVIAENASCKCLPCVASTFTGSQFRTRLLRLFPT